jgi:uncharacterized membrane protein YdbT with pleckstrin-like domain
LVALGIVWYNYNLTPPEPPRNWLFIFPAFIVGGTLVAHGRRVFTRLHLEDYRLRFESGLFTKTTRIMELRKVQDVRVEQNLFQRMLNTGTIAIETAGESSGIVMVNIDRPQFVADTILHASHNHYKQDQTAGGPSTPSPDKA